MESGILRGMLACCLFWVLAASAPPVSARAAGDSPAPLAQTVWVLYDLRDPAGQPVPGFGAAGAPTIVPVLFLDDALIFSGACRQWRASYRRAGDRLVIGPPVVSGKGCHGRGPVDEVAERLSGAMRIEPQAAVAGTPGLRLRTSAGEALAFYRAGAAGLGETERDGPPQALHLQIGPGTMECGFNGPSIPGRRPNICVVATPVVRAKDGRWTPGGPAYPIMPHIRGLDARPGERSIVRILRYRHRHFDHHASPYADVLDAVIERSAAVTDEAQYRNPANHWVP